MARLFLDTNVFIYFFSGSGVLGQKAKKIFASIFDRQNEALTSIITKIELLSQEAPEKEIHELLMFLQEIPSLGIIDLGSEIAIEAARIRRNYHYRLPDAVQLATALHSRADVFITNDQRLANFPEIKIGLL